MIRLNIWLAAERDKPFSVRATKLCEIFPHEREADFSLHTEKGVLIVSLVQPRLTEEQGGWINQHLEIGYIVAWYTESMTQEEIRLFNEKYPPKNDLCFELLTPGEGEEQ